MTAATLPRELERELVEALRKRSCASDAYACAINRQNGCICVEVSRSDVAALAPIIARAIRDAEAAQLEADAVLADGIATAWGNRNALSREKQATAGAIAAAIRARALVTETPDCTYNLQSAPLLRQLLATRAALEWALAEVARLREALERARKAYRAGQERAGTMPARDAVKVRPADWHAIEAALATEARDAG